MALLQTEIKLDLIGQTMSVALFFPSDRPEMNGGCKGVITLLHGMSNTGYDWMTMTAAPRYAAENGYILVAPEGGNSFYQDMRFGAPWYTALTELLPEALARIFNIPTDRDKNFIAGNSMGGYGALRFALAHPERWAAAGSFSGVLDLRRTNRYLVDEMLALPLVEGIWGEGAPIPEEADLLALAKEAAALPKAEQPRLLCTVGRQDTEVGGLAEQTHAFADAVRPLGLDFTLMEWDGVHEWNFWDRSLAQFIGFIQHSGYAQTVADAWTKPMETAKGAV